MTPEQARTILEFHLSRTDYESDTLKKVIGAIPEDKKNYKPAENSRTAFELAVHTATSDVWFLEGIAAGKFDMPEDDPTNKLKTVADVLAWYEKALPAALAKVKALPAEKLAEPIDFFGMKLPAVAYYHFMVVHQVHHRGQISAYLRPMGAKVPDIYGGSYDVPFEMPAGAGQ